MGSGDRSSVEAVQAGEVAQRRALVVGEHAVLEDLSEQLEVGSVPSGALSSRASARRTFSSRVISGGAGSFDAHVLIRCWTWSDAAGGGRPGHGPALVRQVEQAGVRLRVPRSGRGT